MASGTTTYGTKTPANIAALDGILHEWSSGHNYSTRVGNLGQRLIPGD
jgi:hypothetical protein